MGMRNLFWGIFTIAYLTQYKSDFIGLWCCSKVILYIFCFLVGCYINKVNTKKGKIDIRKEILI